MPIVKAGSVNLHYQLTGEGEPLLLIMGFGMPGVAWAPMIPLLQGFQCISFDNRGTGASDKPEGVYHIADMADDAANLLDALGIAQAKVYGVSMGGMIAQELALRHRDKVTRLVLGCTMAGGTSAKLAPSENVDALMYGIRMMATNPDKGLDTILPLLYPADFVMAHPEIKQFMLAGLSSVPPTPAETAERQMEGILNFDAYDRLHEIQCPVLIIHGDKDVLVPVENAHMMKGRIPNAQLLLVHGAGHGYQATDPVGIHQKIVGWLKAA